MSRAVACNALALLLNAVKAISGTSASLIHCCAVSSQIALVYLIGVHASAAIASMALRTGEAAWR